MCTKIGTSGLWFGYAGVRGQKDLRDADLATTDDTTSGPVGDFSDVTLCKAILTPILCVELFLPTWLACHCYTRNTTGKTSPSNRDDTSRRGAMDPDAATSILTRSKEMPFGW